MTPFECFKTYSALKLHFTSDYNYFQYNGQLKVKPESFERRSDKLFFAKVAKHTDPLNFLMVNILEKPRAWIRDIAYNTESESKYSAWLKRKQSLTYLFREDLKKLDQDFDLNLKAYDGNHPPIIVKYLSSEILLETVCIVCSLTGCLKIWDKKMAHDPVWEEISLRIKKYTPFMSIDSEKCKKIILDTFKQEN